MKQAEGTVLALAAEIDEARSVQQLDVFAPRAFADAARASQAATREAERGRSAERIAARMQEARQALQRARAVADTARQTLAGVIKTRQETIAAEAPKLSGEAWVKANERFQLAMRENEVGDLDDAHKRAAEAEVLLREAELIAIKASILVCTGSDDPMMPAEKLAAFRKNQTDTVLAAELPPLE